MSIYSKISGPHEDIVKYLERYEKSWVAEELLTINKVFTVLETILNVAMIISGVIITIMACVEFGFLGLLLGWIGTVLAECLYLFLIRLRRLRFFVKIENIILLEEIKFGLNKVEKEEQKA